MRLSTANKSALRLLYYHTLLSAVAVMLVLPDELLDKIGESLTGQALLDCVSREFLVVCLAVLTLD